ncbi:MAG: glycosyltransferase family 9 protein, partial [Thermodesulfobacteriota bacterium]|nr:glycosyltransferase family 9 protein [Thermodesulfobacteriota bacterium]
MEYSYYRERWSALMKDTAVDPDRLERLARQVAHSFLDYYLKDCRYEEEYIDLLCEMTTFSWDPKLANPPTGALFGIIIESLCDDFEELQTVTYNKVMAQVISHCRNIPAGRELDAALRDFGIHSSKDILDRVNTVRSNSNCLSGQKKVRKVILLSRVTIGADVAITSIVIQRLNKIFPEAEFVLIGGGKLQELFGENPRIRIRRIQYSRNGGVLERLSSWHSVLEIIQQEMRSCPVEETILVDPDSRFSQLGILPIFPNERYFFFDSRSDSALNKKMSMSELTNSWLDKVTGEEGFCYPKVWIPQPYLDLSKEFCKGLRSQGARRIIVANFGVGGNPRKRVGRHLEEGILISLLQEANTVVLLDKGLGDEELAYTNSLVNAIDKQGYAVLHTSLDSQGSALIGWGLIGIESRIGEVAALIAECDEFIGYDSACQHIAAALLTPCLTIFAGSNNMRFIRRWSAYGRKS